MRLPILYLTILVFCGCEENDFLRKEWDIETTDQIKPVISAYINPKDSIIVATVNFVLPLNSASVDILQQEAIHIQLLRASGESLDYYPLPSFDKNVPYAFRLNKHEGFIKEGETYEMVVEIDDLGTYRASTAIPLAESIPDFEVHGYEADEFFENFVTYDVSLKRHETSSDFIGVYQQSFFNSERDAMELLVLLPTFNEDGRWRGSIDVRYGALPDAVNSLAVLDAGYHDYLVTLNQKLLQNEDPFAYFSKTPTNFDNGAIGYFGAINYKALE